MLIFSPDWTKMNWALVHGSVLNQGFLPEDLSLSSITPILAREDHFVYDLPSASFRVEHTTTILTDETLPLLEESIPLLPQQNGWIAKIVHILRAEHPSARHILLNENAFFHSMPTVAKTYGLPESLRTDEVYRRGADGLTHSWVTEQLNHVGVLPHRAVSVHLGSFTTTVALLDGVPVETSAGFSPLEGILSSTGCGTIDPAIILDLHNHGILMDDLEDILTQQSGFSSLVGHACSLDDLLINTSDSAQRAQKMLTYQVVKSIGAMIAALGGIELIAFSCDNPSRIFPLIQQICQNLSFLGIDLLTDLRGSNPVIRVSSPMSRVPIDILEANPWVIRAEAALH